MTIINRLYRTQLIVKEKIVGNIVGHGGHVLLEEGDEYKITVFGGQKKFKAEINIDGKNVLGSGYLLSREGRYGEHEISIERWARDGNKESGNKFLFVPRRKLTDDKQSQFLGIEIVIYEEISQPLFSSGLTRKAGGMKSFGLGGGATGAGSMSHQQIEQVVDYTEYDPTPYKIQIVLEEKAIRTPAAHTGKAVLTHAKCPACGTMNDIQDIPPDMMKFATCYNCGSKLIF